MKRSCTTIIILAFLLPCIAIGQTVDFNFSTSSNLFCSPQTVVFTQNCTGSPEAFVWRFGNGATGTSPTETITYTAPGTYEVTLSAVYPSGGISVTKIIVINPTPTISITADRDYICQPGGISFTASGSAFITSYEWDFGDGSPLVTTGTNTTTHNFSAYGNYTVTVRGITVAGCYATASIPVRVQQFPIVNPTVTPTEGCIPVNASFSALVDLPAGDSPSNFAWNFGDGSPVSNTVAGNTTHLYNIVTPVNTASVTITSTQGCTNQYTFPLFAFGTPPFNTTVATADGRAVYCASEIITFNGTAVNANSYRWDFGDGTTETTVNTSITHRYRALGPMHVTMTPYFNGCAGPSAFVDITIEGVVASYDFGNQCGTKNTFIYTNTSSGNISSFRWDFSDTPGSPDFVNYHPRHTFPSIGSFTTQLYVYDAITGCSDSLLTSQYTALPAFTSTGPDVCKDSVITYSVQNTYPLISGYEYEFHVNGAVVNTGVTSSIDYTPTVHGSFTDFVIISSPNPYTCDDTLYLSQPTRVGGPVLDFTMPLSACWKNNSFPITNNTVPFFPSDNITTWAWSFGDGTTSNQQNPPPHNFPVPANFWVKLRATDINNCSQEDSVMITILATPQIAVFPKSDTLCTGQSMNLFAFTADTLLWTTNYNIDCITCDTVLVNPMVTTAYVAQATNSLGCINTDTSFIRVFGPITLQVNPADTSVCPGGTVQYSSNTNGIYNWTPTSFLSSPTIPNPLSSPDSSITYTVVVSDSAGCYSDTATARITIFDPPTVDAGPDQVIPYNNPFTISPVYSAAVSNYLWSPSVNGLSCTTCPVVSGTATTTALYTIRVTDENSCEASDQVRIIVACDQSNLNVPSGFTPNNDGRNDYFYPLTRGYSTINKMIVFDRWGDKVFERNNFAPNTPTLGWDGRTKDKQYASTAVFVYIIEAVCDAGETVQAKGTVTVIR